ncbi:MAG: DNA-processing protein DprA [Pseudomonadota bacterium]
MNEAQISTRISLHSLTSISASALTLLLQSCDSPEALLAGGKALWRDMGLSEGIADSAARELKANAVKVRIETRLMQALDASIVAISDPNYPPLLRHIPDPPPLLYIRGEVGLLSQPQVAMVGSRKASAAGMRAARSFSSQLARSGLIVTSGLALGIDSAGHRGALDTGGCSIAVLATGIDKVYPRRHRDLANALCRAGALVSEFPLGTPPVKYNFPRRNRIVSGLSLGVLVVEAALPSGSLITARAALEQGRDVFALPWSIYHAAGAGCLSLLRDGAKMVETERDILEELGPMFALLADRDGAPEPPDSPQTLTDIQRRLVQLVGDDVVTADELSLQCELPVNEVATDLTALELLGRVRRVSGGYARM